MIINYLPTRIYKLIDNLSFYVIINTNKLIINNYIFISIKNVYKRKSFPMIMKIKYKYVNTMVVKTIDI